MAVPPPHLDTAPAPDKGALRRALRSARNAFVAPLDESALAVRLAAIDAHLAPLLARDGPIAGYVAHRGEPDILPFLMRAHALGREVALPHVVGDGLMRFAGWRPDAALTPGPSGIPQPDAGDEAIAPDILLVPLIGFDRGGHRLGQGGGYYDRWFAGHPHAMRVGIAWSVQEVAEIPRESWDMPLHAIATEKEWICP
jgi:5-formyltetrahydrofolate cyclo-ligase